MLSGFFGFPGVFLRNSWILVILEIPEFFRIFHDFFGFVGFFWIIRGLFFFLIIYGFFRFMRFGVFF